MTGKIIEDNTEKKKEAIKYERRGMMTGKKKMRMKKRMEKERRQRGKRLSKKRKLEDADYVTL